MFHFSTFFMCMQSALHLLSIYIYLVDVNVFLKVESAHKLIISNICTNDSRVNTNDIYIAL